MYDLSDLIGNRELPTHLEHSSLPGTSICMRRVVRCYSGPRVSSAPYECASQINTHTQDLAVTPSAWCHFGLALDEPIACCLSVSSHRHLAGVPRQKITGSCGRADVLMPSYARCAQEAAHGRVACVCHHLAQDHEAVNDFPLHCAQTVF
ncbi:hypothetical protein L226DRAFT_255507 [Lentinus tigrinus ALCF2SS1-7]|uniref:uncharacterized protein n=1 Tax=Lentinus tigrinus ALCF2SS1-7 TaxID=1328758 RepID=UPI00116631FD|nr:hypothetical protein L226DRAFT_255507 [Lentinus tigrinus ALCF2SS1-7]